MDSQPRFRTEKKGQFVTVWIQCSNCHKDIRPMLESEKISVNRGHYCKECDDGAIHLNIPKDKK